MSFSLLFLFFSKALLLLWGCLLSYQTRTISTLWRESTYVGIAIYNSSFILVLTIALLFILSTFHVISLVITSVGILVLFGGSVTIIFSRILYHIIVNPTTPPTSSATTTFKGASVGPQQSPKNLRNFLDNPPEPNNNFSEQKVDSSSVKY